MHEINPNIICILLYTNYIFTLVPSNLNTVPTRLKNSIDCNNVSPKLFVSNFNEYNYPPRSSPTISFSKYSNSTYDHETNYIKYAVSRGCSINPNFAINPDHELKKNSLNNMPMYYDPVSTTILQNNNTSWQPKKLTNSPNANIQARQLFERNQLNSSNLQVGKNSFSEKQFDTFDPPKLVPACSIVSNSQTIRICSACLDDLPANEFTETILKMRNADILCQECKRCKSTYPAQFNEWFKARNEFLVRDEKDKTACAVRLDITNSYPDPNVVVNCPNTNPMYGVCDWSGVCGLLYSHLSECQLQIVPCPYTKFGCKFLTLRKDMDEHLQSKSLIHLSLANDKIYELTELITSVFF